MKRFISRIIALFALVLGLVMVPGPKPAHAAGLCYVNIAAGGANNGSSWADAYTGLQTALNDVNCSVLWVAQGVYKPASTGFAIGPGHILLGGFMGGETLESQRDPGAHHAILSGDIDNNDTTTFGLTQHAGDIVGTNATHVVVLNGIGGTPITSANTTLDGFQITGGQATGQLGGGIYCEGSSTGNGCSPTLTNLEFWGNTAAWGGGLFDNGTLTGSSSPVITDVSFINNSATSGGGGMFNDGSSSGNSSPVLNNVTFSGNSGAFGGAINNGASSSGVSSPLLANVTFHNNTSSTAGGAVYNGGTGGTSTPNFANVIMWGDLANSTPNEMTNNGATPTIDHSVIQGSGGSGGPWDTSLGTDNGGNLDADPMLGFLSNYGGYTETMSLQAGSSALNTGNDGNCYSFDQRGVRRPQGSHCDIGAYERIPAHAAESNGYQTDVAVFRPSTGGWFVRGSFATSYGVSGDDPLPYDFNGDGVSDVAVYRPSTSGWFVRGQFALIYGMPGDIPVPGDYDGNGTTDVAVYRPSTSAWYIRGQFSTVFGVPGDIPVPADYNGDGITDIAVYRPSTHAWYVRGQFATVYGLAGDIPIPADYRGQTYASVAVYRPSTSGWYIQGNSPTIYGLAGDIPVPGDYNGDTITDIAVFRPSTNGWFVKNVTSAIYGLSGDYPLPAPDTNADGDPYQ